MCASKKILIKRWIYLIFFCFWKLCSCAASEPKELSFEMLSQWNSAKIAQLPQPEMLSNFDGSQVKIRGFIYDLPNGHWILAAQPNLKSCCLGHGHLSDSQLIISWMSSPKKSDSAVIVQGILRLDHNKKDSRVYRLEEATVISATSTFWHYLLPFLF